MIHITSNQELTLETQNKLCSDNIDLYVDVNPSLQEKSVTANGTVTPDTGYYGLSKVVVNVPRPTGNINITSTETVNVANYATAQVADASLVAGNIKKDVNILGITGTFEIPTLNAVTIALNGSVLSITNPELNGQFVSNYSLQSSGTTLTTFVGTTFDLTTLSLPSGTYQLGVEVAGEHFHNSVLSNTVTYTV